jgi:hypothetical protein
MSYYCEDCNKFYKNYKSFYQHKKRYHLNTDKYECTYCKKKYSRYDYLSVHNKHCKKKNKLISKGNILKTKRKINKTVKINDNQKQIIVTDNYYKKYIKQIQNINNVNNIDNYNVCRKCLLIEENHNCVNNFMSVVNEEDFFIYAIIDNDNLSQFKYGFTKNPLKRIYDLTKPMGLTMKFIKLFRLRKSIYYDNSIYKIPDNIIKNYSKYKKNCYTNCEYLNHFSKNIKYIRNRPSEVAYIDGIDCFDNVVEKDLLHYGILTVKNYNKDELNLINNIYDCNSRKIYYEWNQYLSMKNNDIDYMSILDMIYIKYFSYNTIQVLNNLKIFDKKSHTPPSNIISIYNSTCKFCGMKTETVNKLKKHVIKYHFNKNDMYKCEKCNTVVTKKTYDEHSLGCGNIKIIIPNINSCGDEYEILTYEKNKHLITLGDENIMSKLTNKEQKKILNKRTKAINEIIIKTHFNDKNTELKNILFLNNVDINNLVNVNDYDDVIYYKDIHVYEKTKWGILKPKLISLKVNDIEKMLNTYINNIGDTTKKRIIKLINDNKDNKKKLGKLKPK